MSTKATFELPNTEEVTIDGYKIDLSTGVLGGQALIYDIGSNSFIATTLQDAYGSLSGSFISGQVAFAAGAQLLNGSSNFTFDGYNISVYGDGYFTQRLILNGSSAAVSSSGTGAFRFNSGTNHLEFSENGGGWTQIGVGTVTSVSNSDSTLTVSPTTGAVVASLNLGHANTWSAKQTFSSHIAVDGYTIDLSGGATTNQVLTFNGTSFVASNATGGISGTLTNTKVPYATGSSTIADSGMAWDNTNKILTITTLAGNDGISVTDGTRSLGLYVNYNGSAVGALGTSSNHNLVFFTNSQSAQMTLDTNGNLGIGISPSYKLDVNGDVHISANRLIIDASSAAVSPSGTGAIRFNTATNHLEFSENAGAWTQFGSGGGGGMSIGGAVTSGTAKSVLYVDGSGNLAQDNSNFAWDYTNHNLGIGTNSPSSLEGGGRVDAATYSATGFAGALFGYFNSSSDSGMGLKFNNYFATSDKFTRTGFRAGLFTVDQNGLWLWRTSNATGTAGSAVTWNSLMQLDNAGVWALTGTAKVSTVNTSGSIVFVNSSNALAQDNSNLFYDATNHRLGLGTSSPDHVLDVYGSIADYLVEFKNTSSSGYSAITLLDSGGTAHGSMGYGNTGVGITNAQNRIYINRISTDFAILDSGSFNFLLGANGHITLGGSSVNATYLLDVQGGIHTTTANLFDSDITVNGSTGITVGGSASQLVMSGGSGAKVRFSVQAGLGGPTFSSYSAGTKLVLWDSLGASDSGFGYGIENNYSWANTGTTASGFKWYAGTTEKMRLNASTFELQPGSDNTQNLGASGTRWKDGYFAGKISLDGYNLDLTSGAISGQVLQYNGTSIVAATQYGNGGVVDQATTKELQLATTGATTVVTYTPSSNSNFGILIYYRVITATTTLTLTLTWTDVTGAQTQTLINAQSQAVGSYAEAPFYFNAAASAITLTATAGTANQVFISADIIQYVGGGVAGANINTQNTYTKAQNVASVALTDATTISTNASLSNIFTITLTTNGPYTLANPTNLVSGGSYVWIISQDSGGSRLINTYGNLFTWAGGITPTLSTSANAVDMISAIYDGSKLRATISKSFA